MNDYPVTEDRHVKIVEASRTGHTWTHHILNEDGRILAKFDSVMDEGPWPADVANILSQLGYTVEDAT